MKFSEAKEKGKIEKPEMESWKVKTMFTLEPLRLLYNKRHTQQQYDIFNT